MSQWRYVLALLIAGSLSGVGVVAGDVPEFSDDFEDEDPCASGDWVCNGAVADGISGGWREPDGDICLDVGDVEPCNLTDDESGYVLVAQDANDTAGNMFRTDAFEWDNFRLKMTVEMRDGSATPADGMAVVILGSEDPPGQGITPALGGGGGGMGSMFGVGMPHMIFQFDNWNNGATDNNNNNHVGFNYFPDGHAANDQVTQLPGQSTQVNLSPPLNDPTVESNRWEVTVLVQGGTVAYNLRNEAIGFGVEQDGELVAQRMFTLKIRDFEPFEGFLGVTANTGGANQNHLLHDVSVVSLPDGFCLSPPANLVRTLDSPLDPLGSSGDYEDGTEIAVALELADVRVADDNCPAAGAVVITEQLPVGWTAMDISDGGAFDAGASMVTFNVPAVQVTEGKTVTYTLVAIADEAVRSVNITGGLVEDLEFAEPNATSGDSLLYAAFDFGPCGGIRAWNILGAYGWSGINPPPVDEVEADYLTDGDITETDFVWFPGATVATDFGGDSAALSLFADPNNRNPGGIPTVLGWNRRGEDGNVALNDIVYGGDPNNVMNYMQAYIINDSGDDLEVAFKAASDDGIQVILNGESILTSAVARGSAGPCEVGIPPTAGAGFDYVPDNVTTFDFPILEQGVNSVIVKIFEIGGGYNGGLALLDPGDFELGIETPLTEDLSISKIPPGACIIAPALLTRTVNGAGETSVLHSDLPAWLPGETYGVELEISDIRDDSFPGCDTPASIIVTETVPLDWTVANISDGGAVVGETITWTLSGAAVAPTTLTYDVTTFDGVGIVTFKGNVLGDGDLSSHATRGNSSMANPEDFGPDGYVMKWLLLGPYAQEGGLANPDRAAPGEDRMREDYLTDGAGIDEVSVTPQHGDTVETDYSLAASTGLSNLTDPTCPINLDGVPTWKRWIEDDQDVNYDDYYCGDINDTMMYSVMYVRAEEDMSVGMGTSSDDSLQVIVNDVEVYILSIPRGRAIPPALPQDTIPSLDGVWGEIELNEGINRVMVKIFEGGGGHGFSLRFQDPVTAEPFTEGLEICLTPDCSDKGDVVDPGGRFRRGDVNDDGGVNIADPVFLLNNLFAGGPETTCEESADMNDDGGVNIADPVFLLNNLFAGGPAMPNPSPDCGTDPNAGNSNFGCETHNSCN